MTFRADIYAALVADPTLVALVGTRIYPEKAPQDPTLPFIVYYEFANPVRQSLSGPVAVDRPRVQYSTYSTSYAQSLAVVAALRDAVLSIDLPIVIEDERGGADMTTGLHRRDLDVRISHG